MTETITPAWFPIALFVVFGGFILLTLFRKG
jgi:hypothetical protein